MEALSKYADDEEEEEEDTAKVGSAPTLQKPRMDFAPDVKVSADDGKSAVEVAVSNPIGSGSLVLHNPRAHALWAREQGPANPFQRVRLLFSIAL